MITYKDIKKAINQRIKSKFDNIEINSRDVTEGFNRPSFFVGLENNERSGDLSQVHKSLTVQIYYFPTDRYDYAIEVLDIQEQLETAFEMKLKVLNRFFNVDDAKAVMTDGVLSFSFDIAFYEARDYEIEKEWIDENKDKDFYEKYPVELMAELDIEQE
ncbi:hypothetical protein BK128_21540 [Viridibacillus sp. FSL H7-0596]|uniref:phage tail terminator family protein n=1 Tax=Viridibacillus sp. FSL H7-0596 TaxID=1928923 RepID=UPI00096CB8B3|nr:hypothetical protein [Viridibacillus sp. FSL H7-0596]OMC81854.1 hypothetical protein BK128_21540 [Viridibacillus sp. FSL H7-0596]